MHRQLVALTGPKGVGKSSIAKEIEDILIDADILSFAAPIKGMARAMGIHQRQIDDPILKNERIEWLGKSPREIMQSLGTDWGRAMVHDDLWLKIMQHKIAHSPFDRLIIDDCRFDNEAAFIKATGGTIVQLHRTGIERNDPHSSESGISGHLVEHVIDAGNVNQAAIDIINLTFARC